MGQSKERLSLLKRLEDTNYDAIVIGGGATGAGTALDLSLRGIKTALLEKNDFSSGTSSRSTKLIHGGVRYLAQFHFGLIHEALTERKSLLKNAPHLVKPLKFILPAYSFFEKPYYSIGLTLYDVLAGSGNLPHHKRVSYNEIIEEFPGIEKNNLKGGITYYDAQFNDARLNVLLAVSANKEGTTVASRMEVQEILKSDGKSSGVIALDKLTGKKIRIQGKAIVNTAGVHIDEIRKMDDPKATPLLAPSQGIHLIFNKEKIPCKSAMIIPKTSDGRVVFIIPWENFVLMGTTDTPISKITDEPLPLKEEVDFLIKTGNEFLQEKIDKKDVLSVFAGLRPLISAGGGNLTKNISREESILVSDSGMITMSGGKWSTYRKMAENLCEKIIKEAGLNPSKKCSTATYIIPGGEDFRNDLKAEIASAYKISDEKAERLMNFYGKSSFEILGKSPKEILPNSGYFKEEVEHFIRKEFALSTLDVLARRFRILFLDLNQAEKMVEPINEILAKDLDWSIKEKKSDQDEARELIRSLVETYR